MKINCYTIFRFRFLIAVLSASILVSCASKKDIIYFQDAENFETLVEENTFSPKFKVDDIVGIHISTLNPEASIPFNLFRGGQEGGVRPEQVDYIVDKDGNIDFPVIGKLKIVGLSPEELRVLLRERLADYLKDPIINIRLKNFTVTILGDVNRPGTYPVNGEQITILEALGLAGDLSIKGLRNNILVVRDFDGTKAYYRIDLTSKSALKSPAYYLTQNDVVYVEPNKSRIASSSLDNRASIGISLASIVITSAIIIIVNDD